MQQCNVLCNLCSEPYSPPATVVWSNQHEPRSRRRALVPVQCGNNIEFYPPPSKARRTLDFGGGDSSSNVHVVPDTTMNNNNVDDDDDEDALEDYNDDDDEFYETLDVLARIADMIYRVLGVAFLLTAINRLYVYACTIL